MNETQILSETSSRVVTSSVDTTPALPADVKKRFAVARLKNQRATFSEDRFRIDEPTDLPTQVAQAPDTQPQDSIQLMQKWQGVVTEILDDSFLATLKDLSVDGEDEEAEIYKQEISPADKPLLAKGAVFYWYIGYRDTAAGQRRRESEIRFRRFPTWSKRQLDRAQKEAQVIVEVLNWENERFPTSSD